MHRALAWQAPLSEWVRTTHTGSASGGRRDYHPDFGGAAQFAVLGEHPAVVGQQHLQRVAHGDDEGHPQARAEDDAADHVLHLAGHAAAAGTSRECVSERKRLWVTTPRAATRRLPLTLMTSQARVGDQGQAY